MKTYSSLDLLGEKLNPYRELETLWDVIRNRFIPKTKDVHLDIEIPIMTYLRTETYCEVISEEIGISIQSEHFLQAIYESFIFKFYRYQQHKKAYELLSNYDGDCKELIIKDYQSNKEQVITKNEKIGKKVVSFRFKRSLILRGELLLAEIDERYHLAYTVERLVEIIWMDFIRNTDGLSEKKVIQNILSIIKEELD